ncbi:hypothetical protein LMB39_07090 [Limosilactobacillus reuteri]|uniref:hypothetical protein n=1 Tax=Limosilactobacillus reuteri TaxID=1598 RepID=UPI001E2C155E|nr:hypothetical protein [Limosilactobacillus reuteri]MCC4328268.1 hypothetical protein [Limosilactobacillus reuteri]MCC4336535.1 hypothetical protein [Limosilactobacillus reuteri]MCC4338308.1 hypothetical protein [Limosilactobacillus reuteri]MCC4347950.1 hypothetical protein [Limosilactobacillus reuteri]MCC4374757.1 hypothetical protein [Limosilactobacillus reuteri]
MTMIIVIAILLSLLSIFYVVFVFVQDFASTIFVFKRSFELAFIKKKREESIKQTTEFLNDFFSVMVNEVVSSSDKKLQQKLNLSKDDVKEFKTKMQEAQHMGKKSFISEDVIKRKTLENKSFNFINQVVTNTKDFSNDKVISLQKITKLFEENKITKEQYVSEFLGLKNLTPKQAKIRALRLEKEYKDNSLLSILPFARDFVKNKWDGIQAMYEISLQS